jgi:hypothetical protein
MEAKKYDHVNGIDFMVLDNISYAKLGDKTLFLSRKNGFTIYPASKVIFLDYYLNSLKFVDVLNCETLEIVREFKYICDKTWILGDFLVQYYNDMFYIYNSKDDTIKTVKPNNISPLESLTESLILVNGNFIIHRYNSIAYIFDYTHSDPSSTLKTYVCNGCYFILNTNSHMVYRNRFGFKYTECKWTVYDNCSGTKLEEYFQRENHDKNGIKYFEEWNMPYKFDRNNKMYYKDEIDVSQKVSQKEQKQECTKKQECTQDEIYFKQECTKKQDESQLSIRKRKGKYIELEERSLSNIVDILKN